MRDALIQIYIHFVWSTWDRLPLITPEKEAQVYKAILAKCDQLGGIVLALGGIADHLHLLVRFPSTVSIADFIKGVKGSTSHLMTHQVNPNEFFKWQGSYAAFSVSEGELSRVRLYIERQKEHHKDNQVEDGYEFEE